MFLISRLTAALSNGQPTALIQVEGEFVSIVEGVRRPLLANVTATIESTEKKYSFILRIVPEEDPDDVVIFPISNALDLSRTDESDCVLLEFVSSSKQRRGLVISKEKNDQREIDAFDQVLCSSIFEFENEQTPTEANIDQVMGYCKRKKAETNENQNEGITMLKYDQQNTKTFVPVCRGASVGFENKETKSAKYALQVNNSDGTSFYESLLTKMNGIEFLQNCLIWLCTKDHKITVYQIKFSDATVFAEFQKSFVSHLYQSKTQEDAKSLKDDIEWVTGAFQQKVNIAGDEEEDDDEDEKVEFADQDENGEISEDEFSSDDEEDDSNDRRKSSQRESGVHTPAEKNSKMALTYKHQRAFVSRGANICVTKFDNDGSETVTTLEVSDPSGKGILFTPSKLMLHDNEDSLLLLDPNRNDSVFRMDLNRGKVVEEWKSTLHDVVVPTCHIQNREKFSQKTGESSFICANNKDFFRMDPRVSSKSKIVESDIKRYTKQIGFSCLATTGKGQLVLGSNKGELRLFNTASKINQNANTQFPGLGDPLIGVDVTEDGTWLLGTTKTYLIVIPTTIPDESGKTGFEKRMGTHKPIPRKLQLRHEDVARLDIRKVHFTPARFSVDEKTNEHRIVTSTGPYLITWNFTKVKKNVLDDYRVQRMKETVVDEQFVFGNDRSIVVATKNDVKVKTLKDKS